MVRNALSIAKSNQRSESGWNASSGGSISLRKVQNHMDYILTRSRKTECTQARCRAVLAGCSGPSEWVEIFDGSVSGRESLKHERDSLVTQRSCPLVCKDINTLRCASFVPSKILSHRASTRFNGCASVLNTHSSKLITSGSLKIK